jgi:hypothetical protein
MGLGRVDVRLWGFRTKEKGQGNEGEREETADLVFCLQARPLTRYLPIRKEDFDLKTHIESSGHGVDTCLHVILSSKVPGPCGPG